MTSHLETTTDTDDPITTNDTITPRPKNEGQPEYRARAEAINRTDHNHSNKRTCTPRHHDLMAAALAGPYGPACQTEQHRAGCGPRHPRRGTELRSRHGRNLELGERFPEDARRFHDRDRRLVGPPNDQRERGETEPGQRRSDRGGVR